MTGTVDADPTEAFEIIDDGTRIAILRALADRRRESPGDPFLSFSQLRERVGAEDSGRFNYHLDRLRGRFVEGVDAGYHLTEPGQRVVSAVLAGAYDQGESRGPVAVGADCPSCGSPLETIYEKGRIAVTCENDHTMGDGIPPGALEGRDLPRVAALVSVVATHEIELALEGACPRCYGRSDSRIVATDTLAGDGTPPDWLPSHVFDATCEGCGMRINHFPGATLIRHPAVVSLYYDHGIDVRDRPIWNLPFATADPAVASSDPLRLRVPVEVEGDGIEVTLDETAAVIAVEDRD